MDNLWDGFQKAATRVPPISRLYISKMLAIDILRHAILLARQDTSAEQAIPTMF
jgi:hypothetical protein